MRGLTSLAITVAAIFGTTSVAQAAVPLADCPVATGRYSSDTLLIDLLQEPAAKAVVDKEMPTLSSFFTGTQVPTFSDITNLRLLLNGDSAKIAEVDRQLARIVPTKAARIAQCSRYDDTPVRLDASHRPALLVFERINGFLDKPSVAAAHALFAKLGADHGWDVVFTDRPGAITAANLAHFDAVVWNNISGDALSFSQRATLKRWIAHGGGFAGVHGAGGDPMYIWDWYPDTLIGARFKGHPGNPQFQSATVHVEDGKGVTRGLSDWAMTEEWYSFDKSPRASGVHVLLSLDESTYHPGPLAMGDHPIAWTRCVNDGRSFYSAIGHRPENYSDPHVMRLMAQGIEWAMGKGETRCRKGREEPILAHR